MLVYDARSRSSYKGENGPLDQYLKGVADSMDDFKESDHPRESEGSEKGGQFRKSYKTIREEDELDSKGGGNSEGTNLGIATSLAEPKGGEEGQEGEVPSQERLGEIYFEDGGVSDRLIQETQKVYDAILAGKLKPRRIPANVFQDENVRKKIPNWMIQAYLVGSVVQDQDELYDPTEVLIDYLNAAGAVIDVEEAIESMRDAEVPELDGGTESVVFITGPEQVTKYSTLRIGTGKDVLRKIERLMLTAEHLPEMSYRPVGAGMYKNRLMFELEQKKVEIDDFDPPKDAEIDKYCRQHGWILRDGDINFYTSADGKLGIYDMHNGNVVRTIDGDFICVDPCIVPFANDVGWLRPQYKYDSPPEEL